jgi:hypothetical protein
MIDNKSTSEKLVQDLKALQVIFKLFEVAGLLGAKRLDKTFKLSFIGAKLLLPIYNYQNRMFRVNASLGALQRSGN